MTDPSTDAAVWRRVPDVLHRRSGDDVVVLDGRDELQVLSGAAAVVWLLLDGPTSTVELRGVVPAPTGSLDEALDLLVRSGLVEQCT